MGVLWPRLPIPSAFSLFHELKGKDLAELREISSLANSDSSCNPVGGQHVAENTIKELQEGIRSLADEAGFKKDKSDWATFDRRATRFLYETMDCIPADVAWPGAWSFLCLVVLPDVAFWRYPNRPEERILGHVNHGTRNVFYRLWLRAETVGVSFIDAENGLGEDELVGIMERTSIAANPLLASQIASVAIKRSKEIKGARSEIMRDLNKRVLRAQAVICVDLLDEYETNNFVNECFNQTKKNFK